MNPAQLASKLAGAFQQVVPVGFTVEEYQGMVMIRGGNYRAAAEVAEMVDHVGDVVRHVEAAARESQSMGQDYLAEALTTPWPGNETFLPSPKCQVTETEIKMWFEDESGDKVLGVPTVSW